MASEDRNVPPRPRTGRGRRGERGSLPDEDTAQNTRNANTYQEHKHDDSPINTTSAPSFFNENDSPDVSLERPKTGHGKRGDASFRVDFNSIETPRPRTARGSRLQRQYSQDESTILSESMHESGHVSKGKPSVDILRLDSDGEEMAMIDNNIMRTPSRRKVLQSRQNSLDQGDQIGLTDKNQPVFQPSPPITGRDSGIRRNRSSSLFQPSPPLTARHNDGVVIHRRSSVFSVEGGSVIEELPVVPKRPGSGKFRVLPEISPELKNDSAKISSVVPTLTYIKPRAAVTQPPQDKKQISLALQTSTVKKKSENVAAPKFVDQTRKATQVQPTKPTVEDKTPQKVQPTLNNTSTAKITVPPPKVVSRTNGTSANNNSQGMSPTRRYKRLLRTNRLTKEPGIGEERVALAIKLPTGQRVQRYFRPSETLLAVMKFAETSARLDFTGCEFVCNDPHMLLSDLSLTIQQSELPTKTLLYVQQPD